MQISPQYFSFLIRQTSHSDEITRTQCDPSECGMAIESIVFVLIISLLFHKNRSTHILSVRCSQLLCTVYVCQFSLYMLDLPNFVCAFLLSLFTASYCTPLISLHNFPSPLPRLIFLFMAMIDNTMADCCRYGVMY